MNQVDETTEIIKRAVHDIQPGQKDTVMVACLMYSKTSFLVQIKFITED